MAETIVLDPTEVATGRTQFDITPWIAEEGPDWGDGLIQAYMADQSQGSTPVDFRLPNRNITIPLILRERGGTAFATARSLVQAKASIFQREGGQIKRVTASGGTVYADVVNASVNTSGGWLQATKDADIEATLTLECLPDFYGNEVTTLTDAFSVDTIGSGLWVFDIGTGTLSVSGGQLVPSSTVAKRLYRTDREFYDAESTFKMTAGAGVTGVAQMVVKRLDALNYLVAGWNGTVMYMRKVVAGTPTNLVTGAFTPTAATSYWFRCRLQGNDLTLDRFTSAPTATSTPAQTVTYALAGADATLLGSGVRGKWGLEVTPDATDWRYDDFSVTPNVFVEKANAELVAPIYGVSGDYPARVTVAVDELEGQSQLGLIHSFRSRHYSSAASAATRFEAEALNPLDTAARAALTGASGGTVVTHGTLSTNWTPVLDLRAGGATYPTHTGTNRLWVRYRTTSGTAVQLRAVWDVGDMVFPVENTPIRCNAGTNLFMADLGEVRLDPSPVGTHRWNAILQGKGDVGSENLSIDRVWVVNADESYGVLMAPFSTAPGLFTFTARDEFNQTAGTLTGKTAPVGGVWVGAGDADDFSVETTGHTAQRTAVSDASGYENARFAISGVAAMTAMVGQVDMKWSAATAGLAPGVLLRYTDINNWLVVYLFGTDTPSRGQIVVTQRVASVSSDVWLGAFGSAGPFGTATWYTIRAQVDAAGRLITWVFPQGSQPTSPAISLQSSVWATGGALASGKPGFVDYNRVATASTRNYKNFAAWVPSSDAVLFASQSAELRWDGMVREDSGGTAYGPVSAVVGDLPRLPPTVEGRTTEMFIKASRGDFAQLPDDGIDDIRVQASHRPTWLTVPGT